MSGQVDVLRRDKAEELEKEIILLDFMLFLGLSPGGTLDFFVMWWGKDLLRVTHIAICFPEWIF